MKQIMLCLTLLQTAFFTLHGMENQLVHTISERLASMEAAINENKRIGPIGTELIGYHINQAYEKTLLKEATIHRYITMLTKTTPKSYSYGYKYNPFILKGSCSNNELPLARALFETLSKKDFNPETQRNHLNDSFFEFKDKPKGFNQVDFCVSAKKESDNKIIYIARFFNKEALIKTIMLFDKAPNK